MLFAEEDVLVLSDRLSSSREDDSEAEGEKGPERGPSVSPACPLSSPPPWCFLLAEGKASSPLYFRTFLA